MEEVQRQKKYLDAFGEYCSCLKKDQASLTSIRWWAVLFAYVLIAGLYVGLGIVIFGGGLNFWLLSDALKAALFASVVAGSITILLVLLRGSFRTISERNKDDMVPEHLKSLLEAAKTITRN